MFQNVTLSVLFHQFYWVSMFCIGVMIWWWKKNWSFLRTSHVSIYISKQCHTLIWRKASCIILWYCIPLQYIHHYHKNYSANRISICILDTCHFNFYVLFVYMLSFHDSFLLINHFTLLKFKWSIIFD